MAAPIPIYPSRSWEGNDGNWSTFALKIGNPAQLVHLLPATSQSSIWTVNSPFGCPSNSISNCDDARGMLFNPFSSQSWRNISCDGALYCQLPFTPAEQSLGFEETVAPTGSETVLFGTDSAAHTLPNQIVAAYADMEPFVGTFGISNYSNHVRSLSDNDTDPTPLQALKSGGVIPSHYYAYTAGAYYRQNPPQYASLTLGGYDTMRGNAKDKRLEVDLGVDSNFDLLVFIQDIMIGAGSGSTQVEGLQITANVNSLVPEIWLPVTACASFEAAFGLVWNETAEYYTVNETQHEQMVAQDQSVVISLKASASSTSTMSITLPYSAFDLQLQWPKANITDSSTTLRYFPLKRASEERQFTLGRTFLQESYLAVDYDNRKFFLSQVLFPDQPLATNLVAGNGMTKSGLSTGAIVGIAVGAAAIGIILIAVGVWFWLRRRKSRRQQTELQSSVGTLFSRQSIAGTTINETPQNMEFFKPGPPPGMNEDDVKPELDATVTARGPITSYHRHELSAGSVRRTSQQTGISRATISPIENRHARSMSYGSSMGQPSPGGEHSPSPAGHPSPPMSDRGISWFSNTGPFYELHANEQAMRNGQAVPEVTQNEDLTGGVADPEEGTLPPAERPAPLRTPPQTRSPTERPPVSPPADRPTIK